MDAVSPKRQGPADSQDDSVNDQNSKMSEPTEEPDTTSVTNNSALLAGKEVSGDDGECSEDDEDDDDDEKYDKYRVNETEDTFHSAIDRSQWGDDEENGLGGHGERWQTPGPEELRQVNGRANAAEDVETSIAEVDSALGRIECSGVDVETDEGRGVQVHGVKVRVDGGMGGGMSRMLRQSVNDDHVELDYEEEEDEDLMGEGRRDRAAGVEDIGGTYVVEHSGETVMKETTRTKKNKKKNEEEKEEGEEDDEEDEEGEAHSTDGELAEEEDCEEGEIKESGLDRPFVRPLCRFFMRGSCTWGVNCRFLHPGVNDKGNYSLIDHGGYPPGPMDHSGYPPGPMGRPGGPPFGPPPPGPWNQREVRVQDRLGKRVGSTDKPPEDDGPAGGDGERGQSSSTSAAPQQEPETAWERGLRQAKELRKRKDGGGGGGEPTGSVGGQTDMENKPDVIPVAPPVEREPERPPPFIPPPLSVEIRETDRRPFVPLPPHQRDPYYDDVPHRPMYEEDEYYGRPPPLPMPLPPPHEGGPWGPGPPPPHRPPYDPYFMRWPPHDRPDFPGGPPRPDFGPPHPDFGPPHHHPHPPPHPDFHPHHFGPPHGPPGLGPPGHGPPGMPPPDFRMMPPAERDRMAAFNRRLSPPPRNDYFRPHDLPPGARYERPPVGPPPPRDHLPPPTSSPLDHPAAVRGRGEDWKDPWLRTKSPKRGGRRGSSSRSGSRPTRRRSRSKGSYSYSSSSYSSKSRSRSSSYSSYSKSSRSSYSSSRSSSRSRSTGRRRLKPAVTSTLGQSIMEKKIKPSEVGKIGIAATDIPSSISSLPKLNVPLDPNNPSLSAGQTPTPQAPGLPIGAKPILVPGRSAALQPVGRGVAAAFNDKEEENNADKNRSSGFGIITPQTLGAQAAANAPIFPPGGPAVRGQTPAVAGGIRPPGMPVAPVRGVAPPGVMPGQRPGLAGPTVQGVPPPGGMMGVRGAVPPGAAGLGRGGGVGGVATGAFPGKPDSKNRPSRSGSSSSGSSRSSFSRSQSGSSSTGSPDSEHLYRDIASPISSASSPSPPPVNRAAAPPKPPPSKATPPAGAPAPPKPKEASRPNAHPSKTADPKRGAPRPEPRGGEPRGRGAPSPHRAQQRDMREGDTRGRGAPSGPPRDMRRGGEPSAGFRNDFRDGGRDGLGRGGGDAREGRGVPPADQRGGERREGGRGEPPRDGVPRGDHRVQRAPGGGPPERDGRVPAGDMRRGEPPRGEMRGEGRGYDARGPEHARPERAAPPPGADRRGDGRPVGSRESGGGGDGRVRAPPPPAGGPGRSAAGALESRSNATTSAGGKANIKLTLKGDKMAPPTGSPSSRKRPAPGDLHPSPSKQIRRDTEKPGERRGGATESGTLGKSPSKPPGSGGQPGSGGPVGSARRKSTSSRREELLMQLKAVEDAIAKKRSKMP